MLLRPHLKPQKKAAEAAAKAAHELPNTAEQVKKDGLQKSFEKAAAETQEKYKQWQNDQKETHTRMKKILEESKEENDSLTAEDSLKILFCVLASDRTVTEEEQNAFVEMGKGMADNFSEFSDHLMQDCKDILSSIIEEDDMETYAALTNQISSAIAHSKEQENAAINPKHLLWNLIAAAGADHNVSDTELRLIRFYAKGENIDASVLAEMKRAYETIIAVEREKEAVIHENLSYSETQPIIEELDHRRTVIMNSIAALMND